MTGRRWLLLALAGAASALLIGKGAAQVYSDYLWYASLGATDVWRARYASLAVLRGVAAVVATLFVFANLYAVRQSVVSLVLPRRVGNLDIGEEVPRRQLTWTAAALSAALGIALGWSQGDWSGLLAARHGIPFGESDPYFAADLGFYVYWLPFELGAFTWMLTMILIVIGLVVLLYALTPSLRWENGALYVSGYVRRHLAMLAGVLLLMLAWHNRLEMFTVLGGGDSTAGAFGYLDHRVHIPANLLLSLVTLGAGLTVLWAGWTGQMRLAFAAITGVLVATIGARLVAPFIVDRAVADRDPVARERPYLATRAGYSRRAFGLDRVARADSTLGFANLSEAAPFVPVWDPGALPGVLPIAPGSDYAWSVSDSGLQVLGASPGGAIMRLDPTVAGPLGHAMRSGQDEARATLNFVPDSTARPRLVADSARQIAAPELRTRIGRFTHALSMQDFRIWLGELPEPNPRLLTRRAVRERVRALAPIFVQGETISPVWAGGSLQWAVHLYSASSTYPLSRRIVGAGAERAYFQHAATALVNATTGRTIIVADSSPDPVAQTWMRRFPGLFPRLTSQAVNVRRQLQPARESALVQATALAQFGLPGENSDPARHVVADEGADSALAVRDAPFIGLRSGSPAYVLPVLDRSDRLRGLFIATGGPALRSYWWQPAEAGPTWGDAMDRLRAIDTLEPPRVMRGYVRSVPIAGRTVMIQPRFEWNGGDRPRLLFLGVLESDSVRTTPLLAGLAPAPPTEPRGVTEADFRARVSELYAEMRRALGRGDWTAYGRAFNELGALVNRPRDQ